MKILTGLLLIMFLLPSCATISHKDIETEWQGYGVSLHYKSTVAIDPDQIPAFIDAVNRLEKLLKD